SVAASSGSWQFPLDDRRRRSRPRRLAGDDLVVGDRHECGLAGLFGCFRLVVGHGSAPWRLCSAWFVAALASGLRREWRPWSAYMRRERAQYAGAAQYSSHAASGMFSQSPYSCRSGATLGGAMVYFDVVMPRQIGAAIPHRSAMREFAGLFFEGGFYVLEGAPDRVFTDLVFLEFQQLVDAYSQRCNADALWADAVRGVKRLYRRDCTLALPPGVLGLRLGWRLGLTARYGPGIPHGRGRRGAHCHQLPDCR